MQIEKRHSDICYVMKAFAVLTIVMAHMSLPEQFWHYEIGKIAISQLGVPTFFILSGFFYHREKHDTKRFWQKKVKGLLVPWVLFSLALFACSVILNRDASNLLTSYLKFFIGQTSILWYLYVLTNLFVVFKISQKTPYLVSMIVLNAAVMIACLFDVVPSYWMTNHYVNFLHWVGFFAFGMLIRRYGLLEKLIHPVWLIASLIGIVTCTALVVHRSTAFDPYSDLYSVPNELCGFIFFLNLSAYLYKIPFLVDLGKKSFFIYLSHLYIAGIINTRLPYNMFFILLRPLIATLVCYGLAWMITWIFKKCKAEKYLYVFGLSR